MEGFLKKKPLSILTLTICVVVLFLLALIIKVLVVDTSKTLNISKSVEINNKSSVGYGVVADNTDAVDIGMKILDQGGSAVDAAIAISYALGVTCPFASGLGGGGVMLVYPADGTDPVVYDYMGTAPENTMYNIAVPGFVKGMAVAHDDYGVLSMSALIDPSIQLAREGIKVSTLLNSMLVNSGSKIDDNVKRVFLPDGEALKTGDVLKQEALADCLEKLKSNGSEEFYTGTIANDIVESNGGLSLSDLASYHVEKRIPVMGEFAGYDVYSSSPPLGGVTLIQTLSLVEKLNLDAYPDNTADYVSRLSHINQVVSHERLVNIADPDFYFMDADQLTTEAHINKLAFQVIENNNLDQLPADDMKSSKEDGNTTHIVVYDKNGMMVSVTNTLTYWFGNGKNIDGFFMNSHMDNFSKESSSINIAETGKRPRSLISPTILVKNGKPVMGIGSPGGTRIPMMITQVLAKNLKDNIALQQAVNEPRFFNQKNLIYLEADNLTLTEEDNLREKGYSIIRYPDSLYYGGVNAIYVDYEKGELVGGADSRREASWKWKAN